VSSILSEVCEIANYINVDSLVTESGDARFDHYIAYPSRNMIPTIYATRMKHIFDITYADSASVGSVSISGYNDAELGFLLKLAIPDSHVIPRKTI